MLVKSKIYYETLLPYLIIAASCVHSLSKCGAEFLVEIADTLASQGTLVHEFELLF
jgi:hypothetical protein